MASLFRRKKGTSPGKAKAKSASSGARVAAPGSVKGKGLLGALRRKVSEKKMMGSSSASSSLLDNKQKKTPGQLRKRRKSVLHGRFQQAPTRGATKSGCGRSCDEPRKN